MKIFLLNEISLVPIPNGKFKLNDNVEFFVDSTKFVIPKGFETDLGSVPKIFRWAIGTQGKKTTAYVLHDFFYGTYIKGIDRKFADNVLRARLKYDGISSLKTSLIYRAVRLFGNSHYKGWKK